MKHICVQSREGPNTLLFDVDDFWYAEYQAADLFPDNFMSQSLFSYSVVVNGCAYVTCFMNLATKHAQMFQNK